METKKQGKFYYAALNFIAPGIGQIALKKYIKGIFMLVLSIICFGWALWEVIRPLVISISHFFSDSPESAQIEKIGWGYFIRIAIPFGIIIIAWLWSFVDIIFTRMEEPEEN